MRAVVLGIGWGQVHVAALRAAGVSPLAVWSLSRDQAQACAARLGLPLGTDDLESLRALEPEWVSIATPPATHARLAAAFADAFVLCEKPLVGRGAQAEAWRVFEHARGAVNYAFPFLPEASDLREALGQAGARPLSLDIVTRHDLRGDFDGLDGLAELACHPLSLAVSMFGLPRLTQGADRPAGQARFRLADAGLEASIDCRREPGLDGLSHRWTLRTTEGSVQLAGAFRQGHPWTFEVRADGAIARCWPARPPAADGADPWLPANERAIALAVDVACGALPLETALSRGLTGFRPAWAIDQLWA